MVWPQAGHVAYPWISRRNPSRDDEESRRANRSTSSAPPAEFSRLVSGTRTGWLQTGQRAGFRHVQVMEGRYLRVAPIKPAAAPAAMAGAPGEGAAARMHELMVAVLRQLNKAETEEPEGEGLEPDEILDLLRRGGLPMLTETDCTAAVATLVANGMAAEVDSHPYAWDRARVLGRRYVLTLDGKEYLLRELDRPGRVR
jgi:hypothetical protein